MYLVLLIAGLLLSAAGFITLGFGIPSFAFSLGNTLIIAGTTAVAGGLVLIGVAMAVRQLRRIADALNVRPMPRPSRPGEMAPAAETFVPPVVRNPAVPTRAAMPKPVEPNMPRPPESIMPPRSSNEPRAAAAPASSDAPGPLDWLRPKNKTSAPAEPPLVEDEAPLSPLPPRSGRLPLPSMPVASTESTIEPKVWSPSRNDAPGEIREGRSSLSRPDQIARVAPASERAKDAEQKDSGLFDVVWPDVKNSPSITGEPMKSDSKPDAEPAPRREEPVADKRLEPAPAQAGERPPAILKSGVIDGMAYTLYADGAIEAELPQGTVKFASVDALRAHLEKNG
jgi:hypothetical protein